MRVASSRPKGVSSGAIPPPPFSTGADVTETFGAAGADVDVPPLTTSDDSKI